MDAIDHELLRLLQAGATLPTAELAQRMNLSQAPYRKRAQWLKDTGVIRAQVALCNARELGVGITVFVAIHTDQYTEKQTQRFAQVARDMPEVMEAYRMNSEMNYLLRVAVTGIEDYDHVYKRLIKSVPLSDVNSSFSMEQIKYSTALSTRDVGQGD